MIKKFSNSFDYVPSSSIYGYDLKILQLQMKALVTRMFFLLIAITAGKIIIKNILNEWEPKDCNFKM